MSKKITQWHPAFCSAMELEFIKEKGKLEYEREHEINSKPIKMDLLVIKKKSSENVENEIGRDFFERYNIFEYKNPKDGLNIDTFFKVVAYASLYKANASEVNGIRVEEITISFVRESKPKKLFSILKKNGVEICQRYKGIYDLQECPFFRAQIIVSSELDLKEHLWLKSLTSKMQEVEAEELIKRTPSLEEKGDKIKADSVLQVAVDENGVLFGRIKEDETVMCEALRELFKPELDEAVGAAVGAKEKEGIEILVETMRDMGGTDEAIVARLMEKYNLKEKDAKAYL